MNKKQQPILKKTKRFDDTRGWFISTHTPELPTTQWVMQNVSSSCKGVLRGLHFQQPFAQTKLLTVIKGSIIDVVLDIDPESDEFGQWKKFHLSAEDQNKPNQIYIPNHYAHGFSTPDEDALVCYLTDELWHPESECSINPLDEKLAIPWGIRAPSCSDKDRDGVTWDASLFKK